MTNELITAKKEEKIYNNKSLIYLYDEYEVGGMQKWKKKTRYSIFKQAEWAKRESEKKREKTVCNVQMNVLLGKKEKNDEKKNRHIHSYDSHDY